MNEPRVASAFWPEPLEGWSSHDLSGGCRRGGWRGGPGAGWGARAAITQPQKQEEAGRVGVWGHRCRLRNVPHVGGI